MEAEEIKQYIYSQLQQDGVSVTCYPVTRSHSSITGDETLVSGTAIAHRVIFANPLWRDRLDKEGRYKDCVAIILTNGSITFGDRDLIAYAGSTYEIRITEKRLWRGSGIFTTAGLYSK